MLQPDAQTQLRRAPSVGTNASGIAESIVDAESLAHFPPPPDDIPLTPLRDHMPSPSRSVHGGAVPVTQSRKHFRMQPSSSDMHMPKRLVSQSGSLKSHRTFPSNASSGSRQIFAQNDLGSMPPIRPSRFNANVTGKPPLSNQVEWHEGSSEIIVGRAEERMLSTSFITDLLSSEDTNSSDERPHATVSKNYPPSYLTNDGMSAISELTYPPSTVLIQTAPSDIDHVVVSRHTLPFQQHHPDHSQSSTSQPPNSILALHADARSGVGSDGTSNGFESNGVSVIRTASKSSKLGARGASVVGFAPATLRTVSLTPAATIWPTHSDNEKRHGSASSMPGPDDEINTQRLTIPDFHDGPSSMFYSPAQRSSEDFRNSDPHVNARSQRKDRQSTQSTRTAKSFMSSFIPRLSLASSTTAESSRSIKEAVSSWFRLKPLPRLPVHPDMSTVAEAECRKADDALPLPVLVTRAGTLQDMLQKGYRPHSNLNHNSFNSVSTTSKGACDFDRESPFKSARERGPREHADGTGIVANVTRILTRRGDLHDDDDGRQGQRYNQKMKRVPMAKKQWMFAISCMAVLLMALILGIGLGVGLTKRKRNIRNCPGNFTGNACDLDATCECTSSLSGQCDGLAKSIINLIPSLNMFFGANYTPNTLSNAVWQIQGAPPSNQCSYQALLVDVAPALDSSKVPNRTQWTQCAMLWNLVQSQNMSALSDMRVFILNAPWNSLAETDGPVADTSSKFSVFVSGFIFDFAEQTVTQPSVSFVTNGAPTSAQIAQVGSTASSALDRMYSFAMASSSQRQLAMANYWHATLGQNPEDFERFVSTISTSPILLPFDATASPAAQAISNLLTNSTTSPFPVPLACYPGLTSAQLELINSIETTVLDLSPASAMSQFNTSCFPNRPIYGVIDILQLRLPFVDSRTGVAKQAAVLTRDVTPRVIVYAGEVLSALPGTPQAQNGTQSQHVDPRQYGTLNYLNHVMLNFLSSIPDINIATELVDFILTSPTVPPLNTTNLYQSLSSIPTLEVAVFGTINPSDVYYAVSSLATPSGSLFFGSDQSLALRDWAINGGSSVVWTEFAASPEVVRDTFFADSTFNSVWDPAYTYFHSTHQGVTVNVSNITTAFQATGMFGP